jgi:hypothetical protein
MSESRLLPGRADALAREPTRDEINSSCSPVDITDIPVDRDTGPASLEDAGAELIAFAEPGMLESGEVEAVIEEAATAEERSHIHDRPLQLLWVVPPGSTNWAPNPTRGIGRQPLREAPPELSCSTPPDPRAEWNTGSNPVGALKTPFAGVLGLTERNLFLGPKDTQG